MRIQLRQLITLAILPLALLAMPRSAAAQVAGPRPISISDRVATVRLPALAVKPDRTTAKPFTLQSASGSGSRDSLKNGAVVGAVVGAIALGGFGAVICKALREPSDPGCLAGTLRIAAVGAAIGAGAGIAVDAALTHNSGARVAVRVRF